MACFIDFAIAFNGGKYRPGMLILLDSHICSSYGLFVAQKFHLLVELFVTQFKPLCEPLLNGSGL